VPKPVLEYQKNKAGGVMPHKRILIG